jgi:hemolysin D
LITTTPTIVVQPLSTAVVRSIDVEVGDTVEKGQVLVTLDPTFASADVSQLSKQRRIPVCKFGGSRQNWVT